MTSKAGGSKAGGARSSADVGRTNGAWSKRTARKNVNSQPTVVKGRDQRNVGVPKVGPESVTTGRRADGATVFAGHGWFGRSTSNFMVPEGTTLHFYIPHKKTLGDSAGKAVELGKGAPDVEDVFKPGDILPDYILGPPKDLNIVSGSWTVTRDVNLSKLIGRGMGDVHLAMCREFNPFA
ncbi:putative adhesin [Streptomyces sp. NPDC058674]|uniref:putative adhesin n=1 Tax=Streptomyces sp. NPDC058674 TaxID=3346592 RepID=UPI0036650593